MCLSINIKVAILSLKSVLATHRYWMPIHPRQISITEDKESPDGRFYFNPKI